MIRQQWGGRRGREHQRHARQNESSQFKTETTRTVEDFRKQLKNWEESLLSTVSREMLVERREEMEWLRVVMVVMMTTQKGWGAAQPKKTLQPPSALHSLTLPTAVWQNQGATEHRYLWPQILFLLGGEQNGEEEEQKKQVKRPYAACMRAESSVATSRRRSKTPKLKKLQVPSQREPNKACVHLVFGRFNVLERKERQLEGDWSNVAIVALSTNQILLLLTESLGSYWSFQLWFCHNRIMHITPAFLLKQHWLVQSHFDQLETIQSGDFQEGSKNLFICFGLENDSKFKFMPKYH